jgi:hypothetical protein
MMMQEKSHKLSTLNELLDSSLKIFVDRDAEEIMKENLKFQKAIKQGRILFTSDQQKFGLMNLSGIIDCEIASHVTSGPNPSHYMIKQTIMSYYTELHVAYLNKYLRRWQQIMDRCFEAGLPQMWDTFEGNSKITVEYGNIPYEILSIQNIVFASLVLVVGWVCASMAIICEVFIHDFVEPAIRRWKMKKRDQKLGKINFKRLRREKIKKSRSKKVKARFIQVRQAET